jgi:hypothetical protein
MPISRIIPALLLLQALLLAPAGASAQTFDPLTHAPLANHAGSQSIADPPADFTRELGDGVTLLRHVAEGSTGAVRAHGTHLFYQNGSYLEAASMAVPNQPERVFRHLLPSQVGGLDVRGGLAYVGLRRNQGLHILDVSTPSAIQEVGRLEGRDVLAVFVENDRAYLGVGPAGVVVVDVSNPAAPTQIGVHALPGSSNGVDVQGEVAFVATGTDGMRILDVHDPNNIVRMAHFPTGGQFATNVVNIGSRAYLTGAFGLIIIDVSTVSNPTEIGRFSADTAFEVKIDGNRAYLSGMFGMHVLDISNPAAIVSLHEVGTGYSLSVDALDGRVFMAQHLTGIRGYEFPATGQINELFLIENGGFSNKVLFHGDRLYVSDLSGRLRILDVTTQQQTAEIGRAWLPSDVQGLAIQGNHAYVADASFDPSGLSVVDISDPTEPIVRSIFDTGNQGMAVDVAGSLAYVANGFGGLLVVDVSNPTAPAAVSELFLNAAAFDIQLTGSVAHIASFGGGYIAVDVSNPAAPAVLGQTLSGQFMSAIDVVGNIAALADAAGRLRMINVANPAAPVQVGQATLTSPARGVARAGHFAYVADEFFGLRQYDAFNPAAPVLIGSFATSDRALDVAAQGRLVAVADGEGGVMIFEGPERTSTDPGTVPAAFRLEGAYPNPLSQRAEIRYTLATSTEVRLEVFDVLGRRVALLADGRQPAGAHRAAFDASGLPAGVYVYRLASAGAVATGRLVVNR